MHRARPGFDQLGSAFAVYVQVSRTLSTSGGAQSGIDMHSLRTRVLAAQQVTEGSYEGLPPLSEDGTEICDIGADTDSMIPRTRVN